MKAAPKRPHRRETGLTVLEVLLTLVVIGLIAALTVPARGVPRAAGTVADELADLIQRAAAAARASHVAHSGDLDPASGRFRVLRQYDDGFREPPDPVLARAAHLPPGARFASISFPRRTAETRRGGRVHIDLHGDAEQADIEIIDESKGNVVTLATAGFRGYVELRNGDRDRSMISVPDLYRALFEPVKDPKKRDEAATDEG
jgi:hypothetical protein